MSPETISAVDQLPTREKVCVIPCAKAHRPIGVQTDMARVAVGKAAPSPIPSSNPRQEQGCESADGPYPYAGVPSFRRCAGDKSRA